MLPFASHYCYPLPTFWSHISKTYERNNTNLVLIEKNKNLAIYFNITECFIHNGCVYVGSESNGYTIFHCGFCPLWVSATKSPGTKRDEDVMQVLF